MFRSIADFQINLVLSRIPFGGSVYSMLTDRDAAESTAITVTTMASAAAGKRVAHALLGSAGNTYITTHARQIASESISQLGSALGRQPPRSPPSAFATLAIGVHLGTQARALITDFFQMEPEVL